MKKSIVCIVLSALICFSSAVSAQSKSSAETILNKVSKTYASYKTIKADFSLLGENKQEDSKYSEKGRVYLVPGTGKYKIEMANHALISDGKTQWSVLLDLDEVQITNVNPNDQSISPSNIFSFYEKGYKMRMLGETKVSGNPLYIIGLTPTDRNQNISEIQMRINKSNSHIYDATVTDKNGNSYTYTLNNLETNKTFSSGIFNFYKHNYPGIEIVDLR